VRAWWEANKSKYKIITEFDKPTSFDNIHTAESKPVLLVSGIENKIYSKNDSVYISIDSTGKNPIKKIDVFVNNNYITSLKSYPYTTNFSLNNIDNLSRTNIVRIIGVDVFGNASEITASLKVSGI
jgi:hypothetical protein